MPDEPMAAIGISDILKIPELGRWWQVGAAVVVKRDRESVAEKSGTEETHILSPKLLQMAKKLRFNTDNKRKIFFLLNNCEDYIDAANKIIALRLVKSNRQVNQAVLYCNLKNYCE